MTCSAMISSNGLMSFICLYPRCKWRSAFAVTPVSPARFRPQISYLLFFGEGSDRPGGALKGFIYSSSVSSDAQNSSGVSHGFLSLRVIL